MTNKADIFLRISVGVLLIVLAGVIVQSLQEKIIGVGDKAPDFQIVTDGGKRITRSDFGGRLLVLNFWATWCPPCVEEMPSLDEFQRLMAPSGVVVLGVSVDQSESAYRQFLQKARVSFQTARDPQANISSDYGTFKYPETYVIDSSGRVLQKHIGAELWTDQRMVDGIRALL